MVFKKGHTPWNKKTKGLMPEPWNKNLTKEIDERVKKIGEEVSKKSRGKVRKKDIWENYDKIIKMYREDLMGIEEISKIFFCDRKLIYLILKKNNIITNQPERMGLLYKSGKIRAWCKGLTKETDKRVMDVSINNSKKKKDYLKKEN